MNRFFKSIKGIANQWEVWEFDGEEKLDFIQVFEYKYQADFSARTLNKQSFKNQDAAVYIPGDMP